MNSLVKIVAVSGRPLAIVEDEGMQEIIRPLVAAEGDSRKRTISTDDVKLEIARKAEDERQTVKKKCRGRLIALKLDGVTRLGRGFLGINVQLITSGKN